MTRAELIKALESLEGPSREMDEAIHLARGYRGFPKTAWPDLPGFWKAALPYTSSIDSAITLLKGMWCIYAMEFPSVTYLPANADGGFIGARQIEVQVTSNIPTALCIAALKAQESTQ